MELEELNEIEGVGDSTREKGQYQLKKTSYSHEALADVILAQPQLGNRELARIFGKTPTWVSYVKNSGAFRAYISERKEEMVDPVLSQTIDDRLNGMAMQSMDVLMEKLNSVEVSDSLAIECMKLSTRALGYGLRDTGVQVNNNFVVALPTKSNDAKAWAESYKGGGLEAGSAAIDIEGQVK